MKLDYPALQALGLDYVNRSVYLSGFSYGLLLSVIAEASHRYNWLRMSDGTWDTVLALVSKCIEELQMSADIGAVIPLMTETISDRYLLCDGGIYQREDYPLLYDALPAALKPTSETFQLPDLSGLAVVGATFARPILTTFGEETHTLTEAEMPIHSHTYFPPVLSASLEGVGAPLPTANVSITPSLTGSAGGGFAHNNIQPSISLYWCIVAR